VTAIIEVRELTRRFGDFVAVDAVSFEVERGEIFGYLGANGAGKSTTIRMLCGLLQPSHGSAVVAGADIASDPFAVRRQIGYMSQKFSLYLDLTVAENLMFFAGAYGLSGKRRKQRLAAALELSGLGDRRDALTRELPGGVRQRLALASALLHEPPLLFLDEPTAGVDPRSRRAFWRVIRGLAGAGTTIFVTTHHLDEAEYCGRVGLMVDGKLVALDPPEALKRKHVPGRMTAVTGASPRQIRDATAGDARVLRIQPFGLSVHVRTHDALDAPALGRLLVERGLAGLHVEAQDPTLEDVFLELAGRSAAE
jgi:ABC-2 type transport system ATP-binding protein